MMEANKILILKKMSSEFSIRRFFDEYSNPFKILALIFLSVFLILRLPYFLGPAYVPDEQYQTLVMEELHLENHDAFGAAYWIAGHAIFKLFNDHALVVMRFLAFLSILYTTFSIYRISCERNKAIASLVFILTISSPVFWFGGKIITPEFYQFPLISLVAVQMFCKKFIPWWGYVIIGFVLGIKLSSITIVLFIILVYVFDQRCFRLNDIKHNKRLLKILALVVIGYIIASPNIIFDPVGYVRLFFSNFRHQNGLRSDFLTMKALSWDYIQYWGLLYYLNPFTLILFAAFMIATRNWKILFAGFACMGLLLVLIFMNELFYPWHAFFTVAIIWFGFAIAEPRKSAPLSLQYTVLIVCIGLNVATVVQQVPVDFMVNKEFFTYEENKKNHDECLRLFSHRTSPSWGRERSVMCYDNVRVNKKREGFCDIGRLSNVLSTSIWHPEIVKLSNTSKTKFKDLLIHGPLVVIANENSAENYGADHDEQNAYLNSMVSDLQEHEDFPIELKNIGTCGPYQIIEYNSLQSVAGIRK